MQNWRKGYVFGHIDKFWNGHDTQIEKNACKNAYLGSIFIPVKYVFRVLFESPFTRMISSLKYKWPPGLRTLSAGPIKILLGRRKHTEMSYAHTILVTNM